MSEKFVLSVDAMGGDNAPDIVVAGIEELYAKRTDFKCLLHGDQSALIPLLDQYKFAKAICEIRHTKKYVNMTDKPSQMLRHGKNSSMWNAIEAVKNDEAGAIISAGNTGALMALSASILRTLDAVYRPAIASNWPSINGMVTVLDLGANIEASAKQLVEFAILGAAYRAATLGAKTPRIGLLNIGAEDLKGREEIRQAAKILQSGQLDINYYGFIEGTDIFNDIVDVVVTDGFTGNIALKTAEGTARFLHAAIRDSLTKNIITKLGALIAHDGLRELSEKLNPNRMNGGIFLGLNGLVVKSHGGTDASGFATATNIAIELGKSDFLSDVKGRLDKLKQIPAIIELLEEK